MTKRKSHRNAPFDIAKMIARPVRVMEGGRVRNMPPFEAEVRQHMVKAVKNESVPSMRWLFNQVIKCKLLAEPKKACTSGVVVVPKEVPESYQKEIFDFQPEPSGRDWYVRIAMIIARWFEEPDKQKNGGQDR